MNNSLGAGYNKVGDRIYGRQTAHFLRSLMSVVSNIQAKQRCIVFFVNIFRIFDMLLQTNMQKINTSVRPIKIISKYTIN